MIECCGKKWMAFSDDSYYAAHIALRAVELIKLLSFEAQYKKDSASIITDHQLANNVPIHWRWRYNAQAAYSKCFQSPIQIVIVGVTCEILLALPCVGPETALANSTSVATVGFYVVWDADPAEPLVWPRNLRPDSFYTGHKISNIVACVACFWIYLITIRVYLPTNNPITSHNFNYTPVPWALCFSLLFLARIIGSDLVYRTM